jgi:hypothetical protein
LTERVNSRHPMRKGQLVKSCGPQSGRVGGVHLPAPRKGRLAMMADAARKPRRLPQKGRLVLLRRQSVQPSLTGKGGSAVPPARSGPQDAMVSRPGVPGPVATTSAPSAGSSAPAHHLVERYRDAQALGESLGNTVFDAPEDLRWEAGPVHFY